MASVTGEIIFDQSCADDDHFAGMAQSSKNWKSALRTAGAGSAYCGDRRMNWRNTLRLPVDVIARPLPTSATDGVAGRPRWPHSRAARFRDRSADRRCEAADLSS